jgi:hypothetical protein
VSDAPERPSPRRRGARGPPTPGGAARRRPISRVEFCQGAPSGIESDTRRGLYIGKVHARELRGPALRLDYLNPQTNQTSFDDRRKDDRGRDKDRGRHDDDRGRGRDDDRVSR